MTTTNGRKLDPLPYSLPQADGSEIRFAHREDFLPITQGIVHDPRPVIFASVDPVTHNPDWETGCPRCTASGDHAWRCPNIPIHAHDPNPILVDARTASPEWLSWFLHEYDHGTDSWVWDRTPEQVAHARAVLTRYLDFFGSTE